MRFEVEGRFTAIVEAENGEEIEKLMEEVSKPDGVETLTIEVEEFWQYER